MGAAMTDEGDHGGAESLSHGLRSRWQLCCLTDAAYPLRVLRPCQLALSLLSLRDISP